MARAQNAYKGRIQKQYADFGTAVIQSGSFVALTATAITATTVTPTTLDLSAKQSLTGLSTGIVFGDVVSTLPGNVTGNSALLGMLTNSTGHAAIINTTGTTHKYLLTTTKQPT